MDTWIAGDNAVLRTKSLKLQTDLAAAVERSRDLCWWSRQLLASQRFSIRPIAGAANHDGDIGLIVNTLGAVSLCTDCIVKRTGIPLVRTHALLGLIESTLKIRNGMAPCDACRVVRRIYRLI